MKHVIRIVVIPTYSFTTLWRKRAVELTRWRALMCIHFEEPYFEQF